MKKDVNVIDLSINLGPITLKNPVMPASGTFGYGEEFSEFFDLSILGAVVTKGISLYPKKGNKPPRIFEGNGYLLNSIGLENVGFEMFVKEKLKFLKKINTVKIVNFFGNNEEEYYILAEKLNKIEDIDAIEVNVSCPNVKHGGIEFGLSEKILYQLIKTISGLTDNKVVMVKLSPVIPDIQLYGQILEEAGADVITITNTLRALNIDVFNNTRFSSPTIEDDIIKDQINSDVKRLIETLPEDQKEIIILRHYVGMSFKEIADYTNVSINTALGRMRYALLNLRKQITKQNIILSNN